MKYAVELEGKTYAVEVSESFFRDKDRTVSVGGKTYQIEVKKTHGCIVLTGEDGVERMLRLRREVLERFDGESHTRVTIELLANAVEGLQKAEMQIAPDIPGQAQRAKQAASGDLVVRSQITGKVLSVEVKTGEKIAHGATLAVIEAMKMENRIMASAAGTVQSVSIKPGDSVATGKELFKIKRDGG